MDEMQFARLIGAIETQTKAIEEQTDLIEEASKKIRNINGFVNFLYVIILLGIVVSACTALGLI